MTKRRWRLPSKEEIKNKKALRLFKPIMEHPEYWSFHHKNLGRAVFIGIFVSFVPVPFQMILAVLFGLPFRANLMVSVALVWISNPITMPPMLYGCYRLGKWLLHNNNSNSELLHHTVGLSLFSDPGPVLQPLLLGCAIAGLITAALATIGFYLVWFVLRWHRRRKHVK